MKNFFDRFNFNIFKIHSLQGVKSKSPPIYYNNRMMSRIQNRNSRGLLAYLTTNEELLLFINIIRINYA